MRESELKMIFSLIDSKGIILLQLEMVKSGKVIMGKMTRFVFHLLYVEVKVYVKVKLTYPGTNIHQVIENVGSELTVRMQLDPINLRFRCITKVHYKTVYDD